MNKKICISQLEMQILRMLLHTIVVAGILLFTTNVVNMFLYQLFLGILYHIKYPKNHLVREWFDNIIMGEIALILTIVMFIL